jgi:hypothetical protein
MAHIGYLLIGVFIAGLSCGTGLSAIFIFLAEEPKPEPQVQHPVQFDQFRGHRLVLLKR